MKTPLLFSAAIALFVVGCSSSSSDATAGNDKSPSPAPAPAPATSGTEAGSPPAGGATAKPASAPGPAFAPVQAVFAKNCVGCHGGRGRAKGGINLVDRENTMKGGEEGPVVVAGKPDDSILIKAIKGAPGARKMPPGGAMSAADIKTVEDWVKDGAKA